MVLGFSVKVSKVWTACTRPLTTLRVVCRASDRPYMHAAADFCTTMLGTSASTASTEQSPQALWPTLLHCPFGRKLVPALCATAKAGRARNESRASRPLLGSDTFSDDRCYRRRSSWNNDPGWSLHETTAGARLVAASE